MAERQGDTVPSGAVAEWRDTFEEDEALLLVEVLRHLAEETRAPDGDALHATVQRVDRDGGYGLDADDLAVLRGALDADDWGGLTKLFDDVVFFVLHGATDGYDDAE